MITLIKQVASFYKLFTLIIIVSITLLSLWPASSLPSVPGTDKTHHFIGYAALIFPSAFYHLIQLNQVKAVLFKRLFFSWLLLVIYSGLIEIIQPYVNRYGEWLDLAANSLGLLCGIMAAVIIARLIHAVS